MYFSLKTISNFKKLVKHATYDDLLFLYCVLNMHTKYKKNLIISFIIRSIFCELKKRGIYSC